MDTLLSGGDHFRDSRGLPVAVTGARELIQRALIRLSVKKGSFALDPELGSELHRLRKSESESNARAALSYAQEALLPLAGYISVQEASCSVREPDALLVAVRVRVGGADYQLEVNIN